MRHLVYRRPSRSWLDRLPLGNGRLGAMVGVHAHEVRIGLNESAVWSGGPASAMREVIDPDAAALALSQARACFDAGDPLAAEQALRILQNRYAQSFLPVGELVISTPALAGLDLERSLNLGEGVHTARVGDQEQGLVSRTATSLVHDVLVHDASVIGEPVDVRIGFSSALRSAQLSWSKTGLSATLVAPADVAPGHEPEEPPLTWDLAGITPVQIAVEIRVTHDGVAEATGDELVLTGIRMLRLTLAIETTFTGVGREPAPLESAVARARRQSAVSGDVMAAHIAAHLADHDRVELRLGPAVDDLANTDALVAAGVSPELIALLFDYGRYLLRASSREDGLPANLQGIWNDSMRPPWSSDFTLNINTPMNYWGAEPTGASGAHLALLELLEGLAVTGADVASRLYGASGWVAHHNSDAWGYAYPTRGDAAWSQWSLGGAWLVRQFDEHRRFGAMSTKTLIRFWPVARGATEFLLDMLVEAGDWLETNPSTSPENTYRVGRQSAALTRSSAMDRGLIREVFELVGELALAVGEPNDPVAAAALAAADRIRPPERRADGAVREWHADLEDTDPHHRHVSHLYEWFPGNGGPAGWNDAVIRTLDERGDDSTGWSLAWKLALWARLRDGARVEKLLDLVVRPAGDSGSHRGGLYPNLFAAHPPFQIDGNLGLVGAVAEMLVQSHQAGRIDLLPALPPSFAQGAVRGLIARPGIELDISWEHSRPALVVLRARHSAATGPLTLTFGDESVATYVPFGASVTVEWASARAASSNRSTREVH